MNNKTIENKKTFGAIAFILVTVSVFFSISDRAEKKINVSVTKSSFIELLSLQLSSIASFNQKDNKEFVTEELKIALQKKLNKKEKKIVIDCVGKENKKQLIFFVKFQKFATQKELKKLCKNHNAKSVFQSGNLFFENKDFFTNIEKVMIGTSLQNNLDNLKTIVFIGVE